MPDDIFQADHLASNQASEDDDQINEEGYHALIAERVSNYAKSSPPTRPEAARGPGPKSRRRGQAKAPLKHLLRRRPQRVPGPKAGGRVATNPYYRVYSDLIMDQDRIDEALANAEVYGDEVWEDH